MKLSGEAFAGTGYGIDGEVVAGIAQVLATLGADATVRRFARVKIGE